MQFSVIIMYLLIQVNLCFFQQQSVADLKKQQKKLHKKLRQIQALEDKQDRGEELSPAEVNKKFC